MFDDALELQSIMMTSKLLDSSYPYSSKENEGKQESKATLYTPNLVDSYLH